MDLAGVAAGFGGVLRRPGVAVSADQLGRFVRSLALTTPVTVDELYWLGRSRGSTPT